MQMTSCMLNVQVDSGSYIVGLVNVRRAVACVVY